MDMNITFLGTASSVPTAKRNHTGILVSFGSENILVDCGEGIQRQFKIAKLNPCKLTRILITHWHGDHTFGLPGLLETLSTSEYSKSLQIFGPPGTKEKFKLLEKIYGRFRINYTIEELSKKKLTIQEFLIESSPMKHGISTNAYAIQIKDKLRLDKSKIKKLNLPNSPVLAKLLEGKDIINPNTKKKVKSKDVTYMEKGKKLTIILDTSLNPNAISLAKNSDLLICESSFLSNSENGEKLAKEYNHITAKQAATIAKKSKSKKLILTHLSQRYDKSSSEILDEAKLTFKNTQVAKDLDKVKI